MIKRLLAIVLALLSFAVFAAVDVNKGSAAELDSIKGIGPSISTKIVDERKKGNFKDWADFISRVSGIGETSAAKMSEAGLTVNGQSYKGAAPAAKTDDKKAAKAGDTKTAAAEPAASKPAKGSTKDKPAKADTAASAPKK
jgi:competence protein ComEA